MANLRILARNIADTAVMTASPAMSSTLPVTNLQLATERLRTARTTGLSTQDVKLTWSTGAQKANMVALVPHTLTTSGTLQPLGYSDTGWTTGILSPSASAAFSTSGLDTDIDVYTERDFARLRALAIYFSSLLTTMQSFILRMADASNPAGYMEGTRLFLGKYFEFTYNPRWGSAELSLMDASSGGRADDGSFIVEKRWKARRLAINLDLITDANDLASLLAIARYLGKDREAFVSLYPGVGGVKEIYNQMACRLVDSPTFNPHQYGFHRNTLVFEET